MPEFYSQAAIDAGDELDLFTAAYIYCLYFTDTGEDDRPDPETPLAPEALARCVADCQDFCIANARLLDLAYDRPGYDPGCAGHDFWLTRNGHGAGFWDRGLEETGKALSEAARVYGSVNAYTGDDGLIYLQ